MDIKKKMVGLSLASTVMQGVWLLFLIVGMILLITVGIVVTDVLKDHSDALEHFDPDSVTAGWEFLFHMAGGVFGVLTWIFILFIVIFMIWPIIVQVFLLVYGIRTYKKREEADFKRMIRIDSIAKLVVNAMTVIITLYFWYPTDERMKEILSGLASLGIALLICILPLISLILSIMVLRNVKYIEEEPVPVQPEHIENNEDNSSYLWQ